MARPSSASNASRLATSTTLIPDAAICRTNSLPIPDEAPVTSAHGPNCPLSSTAFIVLFLFVDCTGCSVQAFIPPSTVRFAPVMYEDSGPATNATSAATSSTCPKRSSAVAAFCGTAQSHAANINGEHAIHLFQRRLLKRCRNGSASVVYQDVQSAECRHGLFDCGFAGLGICCVGLNGDRLSAVAFNLLNHRRSCIGAFRI